MTATLTGLPTKLGAQICPWRNAIDCRSGVNLVQVQEAFKPLLTFGKCELLAFTPKTKPVDGNSILTKVRVRAKCNREQHLSHPQGFDGCTCFQDRYGSFRHAERRDKTLMYILSLEAVAAGYAR